MILFLLLGYLNISIANKQQIMINKIVKYIKENNYYGEKYHNYRNDQIESTKINCLIKNLINLFIIFS